MFELGETPADPMELLEDITTPKIHLYNGEKGNRVPWVSKMTALGPVVVPSSEIPNVKDVITPDYAGYAKHEIPTMPQEILNTAAAFFRLIFDMWHTESALLLALDEENKYHLYCPKQEVDYTGVDWKDDVDLADGHYLMGSIHSHCDFSAFHSGTDEGDAAKNDGLHLTFGHIDRDVPEVDAMISFSGVRWTKLDLSTFVEGGEWKPPKEDDPSQFEDLNDEWLDKVSETKPIYSTAKIHKPNSHKGMPGKWEKPSAIDWDEYDDWDDYNDGWVSYKYQPGPEKPGDHKRISSSANWYSDDDEMAQDQILHDINDLVKLADLVGMTITYTVQHRVLSDELLPELGGKETDDSLPI